MVAAHPTASEVYDFLRTTFQDVTYPLVTYDPSTKVRTEGAAQSIASLELNEINSSFNPARNKREELLDHEPWTWEVRLAFQREVDFSNLRSKMMAVPRFGTTRILLRHARYIHPTRQEPNQGSRGEFTVNVLLHPL